LPMDVEVCTSSRRKGCLRTGGMFKTTKAAAVSFMLMGRLFPFGGARSCRGSKVLAGALRLNKE